MHSGWRRSLMTAGAGGLVATAVACGGGGSGAPTRSATPSPSVSRSAAPSPTATGMPTAGAAATAAIARDWVAFFSPKTAPARRVALLENGQAFAGALKAQERSSFASSIAAKVNSVTLTSPHQARVNYTISIGGKPTLTNQAGTAVYQNGVWKVSDSSFCSLLRLQSGGSSALPAACRGA